jgi:hypothetical protein
MRFWALKRQAVGLLIFSVIVLSVVGYGLYYVMSQTSCTDGRQNGNEQGIDCGGSCPNVCLPAQLHDQRVLWQRAFPLSNGIYDAGALVENINLSVGAQAAEYEFKFYDKDGVLLARRKGVISLLPNRQTFVYEPQVDTSSKTVANTEFVIRVPSWVPMEEKDPIEIDVLKKEPKFDPYPTVNVTLYNRAIFEEPALEVSVLLMRADGTIYAASRTIVEHFADRSRKDFVFTWPSSSFEVPYDIQVLYRRIGR